MPLTTVPSTNPCHVQVAEATAAEKNGTKHARGCNCAKSRCVKNYCECWQMGIECNDKCKCVNCANGKPGGDGGDSAACEGAEAAAETSRSGASSDGLSNALSMLPPEPGLPMPSAETCLSALMSGESALPIDSIPVSPVLVASDASPSASTGVIQAPPEPPFPQMPESNSTGTGGDGGGHPSPPDARPGITGDNPQLDHSPGLTGLLEAKPNYGAICSSALTSSSPLKHADVAAAGLAPAIGDAVPAAAQTL